MIFEAVAVVWDIINNNFFVIYSIGLNIYFI